MALPPIEQFRDADVTPELAAAAERVRADWRSYWPLFHASRDEAAACPACNPPAPEAP